MKVFEIKELGETTHIAFDGNKKEALEWYVEETMCDETEIESLVVLPRKRWKDVTVKFAEYGIKPFSMTIEELMQGNNSSEVLCSTAYL